MEQRSTAHFCLATMDTGGVAGWGGVASVRPNIVTLKSEPLPSDDQPTHIA